MKQLFEKTDADHCSLVEYVSTFIDPDNDDLNFIQLPPLQRNAVWNTAQTERLWDSILRGFPIGAFLLCPREKGAKARGLLDGVQKGSLKDGYFLLDGQQRTRSLLLGFLPAKNARLWIDLDPDMSFDNPEFNDRQFLFRVLTSYQPWGMSDRVPTEKISENKKYEARKALQEKMSEQSRQPISLHYDYQVKIDNGNTHEGIGYSRPLMARFPAPFDKLMALCGFGTGRFYTPSWSEVCELVPDICKHRLIDKPDHFDHIIDALRNILDTGNPDIRIRNVVLMLQNSQQQVTEKDEQPAIEVLFRRVNAGGTPLQGEEMAYSMLKSSWDGAYDMVSKIVDSPEIGYLLPPTGIVAAASRLARYVMGRPDDPSPGPSTFRRWIGEDESSPDSFLKNMKWLLQTDNQNSSAFYNVLATFCKLALYREETPGDIGLPRKLLLLIKPAIYQPVIIWLYNHSGHPDLIARNRNSIIQYLVYCFLAVDNAQKASRQVIEIIRNSPNEDFPVKEIYDTLVEEELSVNLPSPEELCRPFTQKADGFLRQWEDIFAAPDDPANEMRRRFWQRKELLLWFQRAYIAIWFKGYNPMSDDAYDTPYDWDHILPYSHVIISGPSLDIQDATQDDRTRFNYGRGHYVNSIGNFRLWPFWENRSSSNRCHTEKFRLHIPTISEDSAATELGLSSADEFLLASAVRLERKELWYHAGGTVRKWPAVRRLAWQEAVETRIADLYTQLYDELGLGALNSDSITTDNRPAPKP